MEEHLNTITDLVFQFSILFGNLADQLLVAFMHLCIISALESRPKAEMTAYSVIDKLFSEY